MTDESRADDDRLREAEGAVHADIAAGEPETATVTPMLREGIVQQHNRLRDAMRRARLNEAERRDVIVSLREGEVARLEMLQDALADVFDSVPEESDLFEGAILPGNPPRMWVDVLAYVAMARDRRTYQFVQEARYGRRTIYETTNLDDMTRRVTDYVANRMLERERALTSEEQELIESRREDARHGVIGATGETGAPKAAGAQARREDADAGEAAGSVSDVADAPEPAERDSGNAVGLRIFVAFLLGMVAGAAALFIYGANYIPS